jgi:hypothetical protein
VTATRRWCIVALGVLLLCSAPLVAKALPVAQSSISSADLLAKVKSSTPVPYSGYVQSLGTLGLPLTDQFTDLADLFGQRTRMRVWWRSDNDWRVDKLTATGETDLFQYPVGTTSWDYESNRATRTGPAVIRLPQTSDLLPPNLARQLLAGAHADEVTRLDAVRVAGLSAPGLRLTPHDPKSSIARVDLWVEPRSGLPLKVAVYAAGARNAAVTSAFDSVSLTTPAVQDTTFTLAPGARSRFEDVVDIAAAANAYAPVVAPQTLSGLTRSGDQSGAVGVYGRGATRMIAIPLRDRVAEPLRAQLSITPGAASTPAGVSLGVAPLNLLLTTSSFDRHSWLLAGTVTPQTLAAAGAEITTTQRLLPESRTAPRP